MADDSRLDIDDSLSIPLREFEWRATRSGGPGGQHVNTSATQVELRWNIRQSPSLDDTQRIRLLDRLANRLDGEGRLRLVSSTHRSQHQNRGDVLDRLRTLIAEAITPEKPRKPTKPSAAQREARLREKRLRSERKRQRRDPPEE